MVDPSNRDSRFAGHYRNSRNVPGNRHCPNGRNGPGLSPEAVAADTLTANLIGIGTRASSVCTKTVLIVRLSTRQTFLRVSNVGFYGRPRGAVIALRSVLGSDDCDSTVAFMRQLSLEAARERFLKEESQARAAALESKCVPDYERPQIVCFSIASAMTMTE